MLIAGTSSTMEKERTKVSLIWGCNHVIGDDDGVRELSLQLGDLRVGNGPHYVLKQKGRKSRIYISK